MMEPFWKHGRVNPTVLFQDDPNVELASKDAVHFVVEIARHQAQARFLTKMITDTTLEVYDP